jgi:acyl carrier protein
MSGFDPLDFNDQADLLGVLQRQEMLRRMKEQENRQRSNDRGGTPPEPPPKNRECPFCGGRLAGEFPKCPNCASDVAWVRGFPCKPGKEQEFSQWLACPANLESLKKTGISENVFKKVRATLVDALGADNVEVVGDATIMGDLGAESIDLLDIAFRLEKSFAIQISGPEFTSELKSATVNDLCRYVESKTHPART